MFLFYLYTSFLVNFKYFSIYCLVPQYLQYKSFLLIFFKQCGHFLTRTTNNIKSAYEAKKGVKIKYLVGLIVFILHTTTTNIIVIIIFMSNKINIGSLDVDVAL